MTKNEMAETIAKKCNVTVDEAKVALEAGDWNMLTAAQMLEDEKIRRMQQLEAVASECGTATAQAVMPERVDGAEESTTTEKTAGADDAGRTEARKRCRGQGLRNLGSHIRRLVACGNRNRFEVRRGGEMMLDMPVTVLALLLLGSFGTCAFLLVVGLFAGCRYGFSGPELGREKALC